MSERIKVKDLQVGMRVRVPVDWLDHPFLLNEFTIRSPRQLAKFAEYGIREVIVENALESPLLETESVSHGIEKKLYTPPRTWEPEKLVPAELREAIHDKKLPPEQKSKIVYESSRILVERLFEDPKAENLHVAKQSIADVVDMILVEDATSRELLRLTSYDYYTYTHSVNVGVFSVMLAKELFKKSDAHDMHELGAAFFLHDIGKVRVNPAITKKPGKLTEREMMEMRSHALEGYEILSETNQLSEECKIIVMQHHEREDGSGYPKGLKGSEIHTYGRICCIADVFDALTADRSYKQRLNTFFALKLMKKKMLNHFQREMFEKFVLLFS
jgi:HD-GYP domain-containing protein (c-di-GMP phosphodiesterase class II)